MGLRDRTDEDIGPAFERPRPKGGVETPTNGGDKSSLVIDVVSAGERQHALHLLILENEAVHTMTTLTKTDKFWDRIADRYAAKPVPDQAVYERKLEITRELLAPSAAVLEIGCGTGSTALALAPHAGHILATDVSTRMIAIAREKASDAGISNVEFQQLAVERLHVDEGSLDAVLAHSLLHLLADWRSALTAAHRALKPGGLLVMSTVCLSDGFSFLRPLAVPGRCLGLLPRLTFFDRATLEKAIEDAGFYIEEAWQPGSRRGVFHVARKPS